MHMCRLWDCSLQRYSLENLSNSYLKTKKESMQSLFGVSELTRLGTIRKVSFFFFFFYIFCFLMHLTGQKNS